MLPLISTTGQKSEWSAPRRTSFLPRFRRASATYPPRVRAALHPRLFRPHQKPADRNESIALNHRPAPRDHCVTRPSASGDVPAQSPAPHSHTPSSHPTSSIIAETNLNSSNNVFSLPFSLTSQTATRRLSITYPCSSDFPFFIAPKHRRCVGGLWFCESRDSALAPLGVFASPWVANPRKGRLPRRAGLVLRSA